ncbi:hypothetical protein FRB90_003652 [Tulasnella sp. 427]|nr:hypothetical protein FRB90_003652 [Tulasnella sp. 427]
MHAALGIPEILLHILEQLDGSTTWQDLARCAQVCRSFRGPATELLWNGFTEIPLSAILNLFPRDLFAIRHRGSDGSLLNRQEFRRRPLPRDWNKVRLRGPQTRKLYHSETATHSPTVATDSQDRTAGFNTSQVYFRLRPHLPQALIQSLAFHAPVPLQSIFGNLRSLDWTSSDLYCCLPFISDSIGRLTLCSEDYELGFFQELEARMPGKRLKELRVMSRVGVDVDSVMGEDSLDDLRSFLVGSNQLRRVALDRHFATSGVLMALGALESLEHLEIIGKLYETMWNGYEEAVRNAEVQTFPALQVLIMTINSKSLRLFQNPRSIVSETFSDFKVIYNGNSAASLQDLFTTLSSKWLGLRVLNVNPPINFYEFIEGDVKMQELYQKPHRMDRIARSFIAEETLKPLFQLTLLEELIIEWPYPVRLEAKALTAMVISWPNLRSLYLTPTPYVILPERPFTHFEDLRVLGGAKRLERLALYIDATYPRPAGIEEGVPDSHASSRHMSTIYPGPCTSLQSFDPGYSWINSPQVVVSRFKTMFPNATLPTWRLEDRRSRWGDVARRIWDML